MCGWLRPVERTKRTTSVSVVLSSPSHRKAPRTFDRTTGGEVDGEDEGSNRVEVQGGNQGGGEGKGYLGEGE